MNSTPKDIMPNGEMLIKMARMRMPFGKYKGRLLLDLPEHYLVWYRQKGFPPGQLGEMLYTVYEIKLNGLEKLLAPLRKMAAQNY